MKMEDFFGNFVDEFCLMAFKHFEMILFPKLQKNLEQIF